MRANIRNRCACRGRARTRTTPTPGDGCRGRMMLTGVLGTDVPLAAQLIIGVVIVAGMVGAIAWVIKRSGTRRLDDRITHGHRPQLAVVDAAVVDERRRLIL